MDAAISPAPPHSGVERNRLTLRALLLHERADRASGWLLVGMLILGPWLFGSTQAWSIRMMNGCGYALGWLLGVKFLVRYRFGHKPLRWGTGAGSASGAWRRRLTGALATLTGLILAYAALAALNARAEYDPAQLTLSYRDYLFWLPHSYHRTATWSVFWDYLAWACAFWALRDWLLGMTAKESQAARAATGSAPRHPVIPGRLRLLLWALAINGAVLGVEGILQRLEGSGKLLFLVQPRVNPGAESQFGPYAYRSNAAQYLNLVWPVTLGFWWWLQHAAQRSNRRHWLLVCTAIMAACPIISSSRAGALTGMALLAMAAAVLVSGRRADGLAKLGVLAMCGLALAGGAFLGWRSLSPRLNALSEGYRQREQMFDTARIIVHEHPVFGTGPGTFEHVFQLYRQSPAEYWPAQLHNDWLELLLTFGWAGFGLILLALALVVGQSWCPGGITTSRRFVWLVWLALAGCLLQARWDFPFRIYSIVLLFLTLCAVLTTVAPAGRKR
jgi:O-antigen ligase